MAIFDQIECAVLTDVGLKRGYNQDSNYLAISADEVQWFDIGHFLLVADGMGAHVAGEKASEQAVITIPHVFSKHVKIEGVTYSLRKAFYEANNAIHSCGQQNPDFRGMGTTATGMVIRPDGAWIGHVGDSRAYRIRGTLVEQLTFDHSLVWEYARLKKIDPDEVKDIPSNYINRCLGPESLVEPDIEGPHKVESGDIFLLCSDGLTGLVKDDELGAIAFCLPPSQACKLLIDLANLRGGHDNITVIVGKINTATIDSSNKQVTSNVKVYDHFRKIGFGLPWWFTCLMFGLLLAISLIALAAIKRNQVENFFTSDAVNFSIILCALILFILGSIGFFVQFQNSKKEEELVYSKPIPRIHRKTTIQIDSSTLAKMQGQVMAFKNRAFEKAWPIHWDELDKTLSLAKTAESKKDIFEAFKHYCIALLYFSNSWAKNRKAEPVIETIWNK